MATLAAQTVNAHPHVTPRTEAAPTDMRGFLTILARHLRAIVLTTLASLAMALAYLAVASPVYTASTTLFIDPRLKKVVSDEVTQGSLGSDLALVESQVAIIGSDAVLKRVVESLKLDEDVEFAPLQGTGLLSRLKALVVTRPAAPDPKFKALENLARGIKVKRAQKTYVVDVEASASTPVKAARITEAIVEAYLLDQTQAKQNEARRANEQIDGRLGELREQVRRAEIRADDFRKSNRILTSEGGLVNEQQLTRLNGELITARAVAAEANARLDQVNSALKAGASPDTLPDALRSGLIQRLREQYAQVARREAALSSQLQSRHPVLIEVRSQSAEIRAQISAELKRIATSSKNEQQIASNREREITATLDRAKSEVGRTNTAQIKLRELEQEVTASRELLRIFLGRAKELQEQQSIATPDARVISPAAVPTQPSKPLTWLILSLGLLGGFGLGIAGALVSDQLDRTVRTPDDIAASTGLPALGAIPRYEAVTPTAAQRNGMPSREPHIQAAQFSDLLSAIADKRGVAAVAYRQALMRLLSRVKSSGRNGRTFTVLFASPHAGAGTSATALGLAYAAALQGERVLLVDAASSDAELSSIFAGAIDTDRVVVLDNREHLASITTRDARSGLSLLPIALADLRTLQTHQRRKLVSGLSALSQNYDLVVIDAGGLLMDESGTTLLPCADRVVLVAKAGETRGEQITATVGMLNGSSERIAGVLLTMTEPERV
ncbi:MAG: exopolysaccharide transport family protein [Hyphomicrobium sp.]